MGIRSITFHAGWRRNALVAGIITGLVGLALLPSTAFVHASFDWPLRFATRAVTNQVVLIEMDTAAYAELHQTRENWNRELHAGLLNYLRQDGCPLVVFDVRFGEERQKQSDVALAEAMRQHGRVAHIARLADPSHPRMAGNQVLLPHPLFRDAATNWGVAQATWESDGVVRRHWSDPEPELYPSLPWVVARLAGATLDSRAAVAREERWLRYYGPAGGWTRLSYHFATNQAPGFFRDKIVFIGSRPKTPVLDGEDDEFRTPYTNWKGQSAGGMEIMATTFLNLVNRDWLRRLSWWQELLAVMLAGALMGGGFSLVRWPIALTVGLVAAAVVAFAGVWVSHFTNWWFPWLVVAGAQIPVAVGWGCFAGLKNARRELPTETVVIPPPPLEPKFHDYEKFMLLGKGGYGEVWLVRNAVKEWQALKVIYCDRFPNTDPYEREFNGLQHYRPISHLHAGLLRIDFVSMKRSDGHFYYVMELGDSETEGWEERPEDYRALNLENKRARDQKNRLPLGECVRIGIELADALDYLHQQGLIHRDVKPSNIIFVRGKPKLADVGLVTEIQLLGRDVSQVGTLDYMPPEGPGKPQADIYALGMVIYSISTGGTPSRTLDLSQSLVESNPEFMFLNKVLWKACARMPEDRYATAAELRDALMEVDRQLAL